MSSSNPKRGPTVLVTDARDAGQRIQRPGVTRQGTGVISVDKILQYASDIPSAQKRGPPNERPINHTRTPSGRHPLDPKLTGKLIPTHIPSRTSKVSEKLMLLPETALDMATGRALEDEFEDDDDAAPPSDDELARRKRGLLKGKTYAEKLPKARRTDKIPRVTAYGTAAAYKMRLTADFVRTKLGARTKLYDDCLYTVYHLPLLPGIDGYRVRSSPALKSPGGRSVVDEEIERNERRQYHEGYFDGSERLDVLSRSNSDDDPLSKHNNSNNGYPRPESPPQIASNALTFAEMFVFGYGVVVFWNFTERQEKDILADLTFSAGETGTSLVTRPQREEDFETEEFHFEYNPAIERPRVYNDMITLRSGDHMIKLAMSHAIAQSTKLSYFEERMDRTMLEARHVPKTLALTGRLGMKREEVVKILGRLFMSRVDVNLSSNMLDVPNFFWDSEPTLHPLYTAVREYLEISPRIKVLNERCKVFLDLAEILSDAVADKKMTHITWIIIVLILLSIFVTCSEVFLRFGMLAGSKHRLDRSPGDSTPGAIGNATTQDILMTSAQVIPATSVRNFARLGLVLSWALIGSAILFQRPKKR